MPARAATSWATRTPPQQLDAAPIWHTLNEGLASLTDRLAGALHGRVYSDTPVYSISLTAGKPIVHSADGQSATYDNVVLALPAPHAAQLLNESPSLATAAGHLAEFTYTPTTVVLHRDPQHMPADRAHWSSSNTTSDGPWAETTSWLGPLLGTDIFKSWITHRTPPGESIASARFQQFVPTVQGRQAAAQLMAHQGHGHLLRRHLPARRRQPTRRRPLRPRRSPRPRPP